MAIQFDELQGSILVPTTAVERDLNSNRVGLPTLDKKLLLVGYKTSAGIATVGRVYHISSVDSAITLFGIGSQLAVMTEAAITVSPNLSLNAVCYAEGSTAAANTIVYTSSGGTATGPGVVDLVIAGRHFRIGVQTGDTPTTIGDNVVAVINAHQNLPLTAANVTGTVTLTARNLGASGDTIGYYGSVTSGIDVTQTLTGATLTGGGAEGTPTSVLAGIQSERFHIIAMNTNDSTTGLLFETHIESMSTALNQKWGFVVQGCNENATAANVLTDAYVSYRMQVVWHYQGTEPCYQLAAAYAAERARVVNRKQSLNFHVLKGIRATVYPETWPDHSDERTAISEGYIPLRPNRDGTVEIVRNVVAFPDPNTPVFKDAEPMEIMDYVSEDIIATVKNRYSDAALKVASPAQQSNTMTPERLISVIQERITKAESLDYLQGTGKVIKQGLIVAEADPTDVNRINAAFPMLTTFPLHTTAMLAKFSTPEILG